MRPACGTRCQAARELRTSRKRFAWSWRPAGPPQWVSPALGILATAPRQESALISRGHWPPGVDTPLHGIAQGTDLPFGTKLIASSRTKLGHGGGVRVVLGQGR